MPCYNAAAFVGEAVASVLEQGYPDKELVVVDDGSSDGSREVLRGFGKAITLLEQDHLGAYRARNAGLAAATGEFVAFLDADDYWHPDCLAKLHGALVDANADLSYCGWQNVGSGARGRAPYVPPDYAAGDPVASFLESCPWPIHAALVRRAALDAVGGFSIDLATAEDYDLWLRLLGHGVKMARVPEVLAFYRWHGDTQLSAVKWRQVLDAKKVKRDFVAAHPGLVRHLGSERVRELIDGPVRQAAYEAYWHRDLVSARTLFRELLRAGAVGARDMKYLVASQLPPSLVAPLLRLADRLRPTRHLA